MLARYEGVWGFESSDPSDAWRWGGLREEGQCGGAKQLNIDIRDETSPNGPSGQFLRYAPDAAAASRVTRVDAHRLTTIFLGETATFELLADGRLSITQGNVHAYFRRCTRS